MSLCIIISTVSQCQQMLPALTSFFIAPPPDVLLRKDSSLMFVSAFSSTALTPVLLPPWRDPKMPLAGNLFVSRGRMLRSASSAYRTAAPYMHGSQEYTSYGNVWQYLAGRPSRAWHERFIGLFRRSLHVLEKPAYVPYSKKNS